MRGESRRQKKTDWKALAVQILVSVLSDLIFEALKKLFTD